MKTESDCADAFLGTRSRNSVISQIKSLSPKIQPKAIITYIQEEMMCDKTNIEADTRVSTIVEES